MSYLDLFEVQIEWWINNMFDKGGICWGIVLSKYEEIEYDFTYFNLVKIDL